MCVYVVGGWMIFFVYIRYNEIRFDLIVCNKVLCNRIVEKP